MKKLSYLTLLVLISLSGFAQDYSDKITLVLHGGAGTITRANMSPEQENAYKDVLNTALLKGYGVLRNGGTSVQAVEATIRVMEDSPLFNAGKGAVFTNEGKNELDASIMEGKTLKAGAIAGVTTIKNPISTAIAVMEKSPHVMMAGKGAETFAKDQGQAIVDPSYFYTESRFKALQRAKEQEKTELDHDAKEKQEVKKAPKTGSIEQEDLIFTEGRKFGTVGCVALDKFGNLAAGTSTGGMTNKKYGRIGDAPIIGAGTYANNATCAVSATGHGEYFIRSVVAFDISALMEYKGMTVKDAANEVVMKKLVERGGEGGIIAVDRNGNIAMPFNSEGMYRGYIKSDGKSEILIYKD
ncbi:isoaspartyl peptidase/L-asparaginase [Dyadobacter chenwenxiniae]|uniref:Isoaspartyl peptidase n=1 Tax=Dyadobacter chenwenxiniae TaxID=2906456 RepID=A0A9X1TFA2_9BACT|nr:isoaspartyl peptidase/L-asparaginase [Dyadobacter chenwenxiniae]MCF0062394.1 isoaspartyl peptidase/L-asparaginase [Dyadobacter chenwenxiniae]UON83852.1 isoaspartyl peptidase/L-asparaginase [Dyadobacter chenwenxiniae]